MSYTVSVRLPGISMAWFEFNATKLLQLLPNMILLLLKVLLLLLLPVVTPQKKKS